MLEVLPKNTAVTETSVSPQIMPEWDPDNISQEFELRARQAEARMRDCRRRVPYSPAHKLQHDMAMGEYFTFNHLQGSAFLSNPQSLVRELRVMKELNCQQGSAYNKDDFEHWRIVAVNELLRKFEPLVASDKSPR